MTKIFNTHNHFRKPGSKEFQEATPVFTKDSGGVAMMNLDDLTLGEGGLLDLKDAQRAVDFCFWYYDAIMEVAKQGGQPNYKLLLMPVLTKLMTPKGLEDFIHQARSQKLPIGGFKLFTPGQSTNSGNAPLIEQAPALIDVLEYMKENLALHMENPDEPDASKKEVSAMENVLQKFLLKDGYQREIKASFEHGSTERGIEIAEIYNLYYTITPHHMLFCQEEFDITDPSQAEKILMTQQPYFFCKPIIQTRENMCALRAHWGEGGHRIMLGSDGAPHTRAKKEPTKEQWGEGIRPFAGIYMGGTKFAYEEAFRDNFGSEKLDSLLERYSKNGCDFYNVDFNSLPDALDAREAEKETEDEVVNVRKLWQVRNLLEIRK